METNFLSKINFSVSDELIPKSNSQFQQVELKKDLANFCLFKENKKYSIDSISISGNSTEQNSTITLMPPNIKKVTFSDIEIIRIDNFKDYNKTEYSLKKLPPKSKKLKEELKHRLKSQNKCIIS